MTTSTPVIGRMDEGTLAPRYQPADAPSPHRIGNVDVSVAVVGAVIETVVIIGLEDQEGLNVRHWKVSSVQGSGANLSTIADRVSELVQPEYANLTNTVTQFYGCTAQQIQPYIPFKFLSIAHQAMGLKVGAHAAKQLSGLIRLATSAPGKGNHGRCYVPFPYAAFSTDGNFVIADYLLHLRNLAGHYSTPIQVGVAVGDGLVLQPQLWHRKTKTSTLIAVGTASNLIATQRRRGDFGKSNYVPPS